MPTTVIVDADHVIRWIDVHPDYSTRSEPAAILAALDAPTFHHLLDHKEQQMTVRLGVLVLLEAKPGQGK